MRARDAIAFFVSAQSILACAVLAALDPWGEDKGSADNIPLAVWLVVWAAWWGWAVARNTGRRS